MPKKSLFQIPKEVVCEAFEQSQKNKVVGVDGQTIRAFKLNRTKLLHELWDQLSSGKYVPSPLRSVYKRKKSGGWRALGIPTVKDNIVLTILENKLSSKLNVLFDPNSYFHKQGKKAAIGMARKRCLRYNWALVLDIEKFADNIHLQLLMNMLKKHIRNKWVLLYTHRMMKAPEQTKDGTLVKRKKGLPQSSKLDFFLVDFYLYPIFDQWMKRNHPDIPFERYLDDIICHCKNESMAKGLLSQIQKRFRRYKLVTHPQKTKIVYCKDTNRKGNYANVSFNFLEATFCSRRIKSQSGKRIALFSPRT